MTEPPRTYLELLGTWETLPIKRFGPPGAFLAVDPNDDDPRGEVILLPGAEIPEGAEVGTELEVFTYLDSEDRPVATLQEPKLTLGEVAHLEVTDITAFGVFVDWGLPKELLVPKANMTTDMRVGQRFAIGLVVDRGGRLAGTMRVSEMLRDEGEFQEGEWVDGEVWREDPEIGLFVILERSFVGLVPATEPHRLSRGDVSQFRVANILPDGKIELSLRAHAYEELANDADNIFNLLSLTDAPKLSNETSPEEIRRLFSLSKKAFKRAIGRLLKERRIKMGEDGVFVCVR